MPAIIGRLTGRVVGIAWKAFKRYAPGTRAINHLIAGVYFRRAMGRWPLTSDHPKALVNDYIFNRMIDGRWTGLQFKFVDKVSAKAEAVRLFPGLCVPRTRAVLPMENVSSAEHLYELVKPFVGTDTFAKPTHSSGAATSMLGVTSPADLVPLFQRATRDFFSVRRETQYRGLPRKVLLEDSVRAVNNVFPDDFKFHCVHGEPLLCQIDHDRFGAHRQALVSLPGFMLICPEDGAELPVGYRFPAPERVAFMMEAARALSAPFDYVRVDLYDGIDGIYFGELTFTPGSSVGIAHSTGVSHSQTPAHREYSRIIMEALLRGGKLQSRKNGFGERASRWRER